MLLLMALMAQDITGPPGDEPVPVTRSLTQRRCVPGIDDIVVCGRQDTQRLTPLPEPETRRVFGPAVLQLSPNTSMTARTESSGHAQLPAPRMMVDFKLDF